MKPRGRRAATGLPVSAMMALVLLVVAVVLVYGAFEQQSVNERKSADAVTRGKTLDQREAELDQRRSALDQRDTSLADQEAALSTAQTALAAQKAQIDADGADLTAREQALASGAQSLANDRAALTQAQNDLAAREQNLKNKQEDYDARLEDYVALQQAVDHSLDARSRIAASLTAALQVAGISAAVDDEGGVSVEMRALFSGSSAALTESGEQALDTLLPVWYNTISGEAIAALSVEVLEPTGDEQTMNLAARRALAILEYAQDATALDDAGRTVIRDKGLSGVRTDANGESRAVFRFYPNNDALRAARAG